MKKILQLSCVPQSTNFALLVLRLWLGLTLFFHHGLDKAIHHAQYTSHLPDPLSVGAHFNMILIVFAEVVCSALVVLGIATRLAALIIVIELAIAFICVHHGAMSGPFSGELAFIYVAGFVTIVLAGGGRYVLCNRSNAVPAGPADPSV